MIKNIGDFNNVSDYLPILNAVIITDLIGIILSNNDFIKSQNLKKWYSTFNLSAVLADVLIIFIVLIATRYFYNIFFDEFSIIKFIILAVSLQIIHDILFYFMIIIIPKGSNKMIDVFKDYADEISQYAILGDSSMMISSALIASFLVNKDNNTNIILLIVLLYLIPYFIYNK